MQEKRKIKSLRKISPEQRMISSNQGHLAYNTHVQSLSVDSGMQKQNYYLQYSGAIYDKYKPYWKWICDAIEPGIWFQVDGHIIALNAIPSMRHDPPDGTEVNPERQDGLYQGLFCAAILRSQYPSEDLECRSYISRTHLLPSCRSRARNGADKHLNDRVFFSTKHGIWHHYFVP